jgi:hypothetical protein
MGILSRTFEGFSRLADALDFRSELTVEAAEGLARAKPAHLVFENTLPDPAKRKLLEHVAQGDLTRHILPDQRAVYTDHTIAENYRVGTPATGIYAPSVFVMAGALPFPAVSPSLAEIMDRIKAPAPGGHAHIRMM